MSDRRDVTLSKFLSLVLRHDPQSIGLQLDAGGWARIDELRERAGDHGVPFTETDLRRVVATNQKQRFVIDDERHLIRANQGHSVDVDLGLAAVTPPTRLYHGTAGRNLSSIRASAIRPMRRQFVQLSTDIDTAFTVGRRHGDPVVLVVDAARMHAEGHEFFVSDNGVWLTKSVPAAFIDGVELTSPPPPPPPPPDRDG